MYATTTRDICIDACVLDGVVLRIESVQCVLNYCASVGIVAPVVAVSVYDVSTSRLGYGASHREIQRYFRDIPLLSEDNSFEWRIADVCQRTVCFCATIIDAAAIPFFSERRGDGWVQDLFSPIHLTPVIDRRDPIQYGRVLLQV